MPRKMRNPKTRIETEITGLERGWFLGEGWGSLVDPPEDRQRKLWESYSDELTGEYRRTNGLFCRMPHWWENEAPEQRREIGDDTETQKAYFLRHPELQTAEETSWLKSRTFSPWELMPCSEMVPLEDYLAQPNYRALLDADEEAALQEYLATFKPETAGAIQ